MKPPDDRNGKQCRLLARPVFTRGHGFGNRLFPWARARVFASLHGGVPVAPRWTRWAVGPLLRGGIALRHYRTQILLLGILQSAPGDISRRTARALCRAGVKLPEPSPWEAWLDPTHDHGPVLIDFVGYRDYFALLRGHEARLAADVRAIARPRWRRAADVWGEALIGVNVRCGRDFPPAPEGIPSLMPGQATPLKWFVEALRRVRESAGFCARAIVVSDGTSDTLAPLLREPAVDLVRPGCAVSDLLALSSTRVLLASGSSSFSAWAAFLGRMPAASHPGQPLSAWNLSRGSEGPVRVEFVPHEPDARFLDAVRSALAS